MANLPTRDLIDIHLRPSISGMNLMPGRTFAHGYIERHDGLPAAFARVSVRFVPGNSSYTTWSDLQGGFVIPIEESSFGSSGSDDDDSEPATAMRCLIEARGLRKREVNSRDPLLDFPTHFDSLSGAEIDEFFEGAAPEQDIQVVPGEGRRYRIANMTLAN